LVGPCGRWWTSGGKPQPGAEVSGFADQRCYAASGLARVACRSGGALVCGVGTVTGHPVHPPARYFTVIPRCARFCLLGDATPCLMIPHIMSLLHVLKVLNWQLSGGQTRGQAA